MYVCRLFHSDRRFTQIDARPLTEDGLRIGRDPSADWTLVDDATLSRIHCRLQLLDDKILLIDTSTNGTFLEDGTRAPREEAVELAVHQSFQLGSLMILVDEDEPVADHDATPHLRTQGCAAASL